MDSIEQSTCILFINYLNPITFICISLIWILLFTCMHRVTLQSPTWTFLGNYIYQFLRSFKHWYPLQIKSYQSFPGVPTQTSLAQATLVIHFPAFLSWMQLAVANLVIHLPAIISRIPLAEANLINTLDFIYIEHDIYCNCIHQKNFKLHKCK
jgi:hypothetical protein